MIVALAFSLPVPLQTVETTFHFLFLARWSRVLSITSGGAAAAFGGGRGAVARVPWGGARRRLPSSVRVACGRPRLQGSAAEVQDGTAAAVADAVAGRPGPALVAAAVAGAASFAAAVADEFAVVAAAAAEAAGVAAAFAGTVAAAVPDAVVVAARSAFASVVAAAVAAAWRTPPPGAPCTG